METKWTSGPWEVNGTQIISESGYSVAEAWNNNKWPQNEANAHLIAAAPEMYEALEELRDYAAKEIPRGGAHHDPVWTKAANALRKARGEHD